MIRVQDQLQIGQSVLYVDQGVFTKVTGYVWAHSVGGLSKIISYELACGINVPRNALARIDDGKIEQSELEKAMVSDD